MFSSLLRKKCTSCPLQYLMMKTPSCSLWSHQHFDPLNKPLWTWTHLSSSCDAQKLNFRSSSRLKPCEHFSPSASSGESADAWTIRRCRWCNKLQGDRGGCRRANVGGESRWLNLEAANKRNDPEQRKWPQVFFFSARRCEYEDESALLRWTKPDGKHEHLTPPLPALHPPLTTDKQSMCSRWALLRMSCPLLFKQGKSRLNFLV